VKKTILAYGSILGLLVLLFKWFEYRFIVSDISLEIYISIIAIACAALGIWMGLKFTKPQPALVIQNADFVKNDQKIEDVGLSTREIEVLELLAEGLSNQEIAEKLFISKNTVKTHTSSLYTKLGAQRRTQAVQLAKQWHIIA